MAKTLIHVGHPSGREERRERRIASGEDRKWEWTSCGGGGEREDILDFGRLTVFV